MSGYIKYFDNSGKNMSFKIEYNNALVKYNEIWRKIKKLRGKSVYVKKYVKAKVKTFNGVVNIVSSNNKIQKNIFITFA